MGNGRKKKSGKVPPCPGPGYELIHTKWVTRGGKRVFASQYGLECFTFWVKPRSK